MDIVQLKYARELASQGTFSEAANVLGISQPALSARIRQLEEELELVLFDRSQKPLTLTVEGERFIEEAVEVLQRFDNLTHLGYELQDEVSGKLKIGVIPTLAPYFIPLFINELNQKFPDLHVEIEEMITEEVVRQLKHGEIDAGLLSTPLLAKGVFFQPLFYERFFLYVAEEHPLYVQEEVDLKDFDMQDLWYLQEGNCFQNQVNAICQLARRPVPGQRLTYNSNSIESLRRIVESRKGMTFIPELATLEIPADKEEMIKSIKGQAPVREISLATSKAFTKRKLTTALVEVALSMLPGYMKQKPNAWVVDTELNLV